MNSVRSSVEKPRTSRVGLLALVTVLSIVASPILAAYEFVLGLLMIVAGLSVRIRTVSERVPTQLRGMVPVGIAILAGPTVYMFAWMVTVLVS